MAKKLRYPRKLRQTLERVKEAVAAREVEEPFNPFETHWHEFLRAGSVHLMHTRLDDVLGKLTTTYLLRPPEKPDVIITKAPWLNNLFEPRETADPP
jgi:hypothetical protein